MKLQAAGVISRDKVEWLHRFLLEEFEWSGGELARVKPQWDSTRRIRGRKDATLAPWLRRSPLARFRWLLAVGAVEESPVYAADDVFADPCRVLAGIEGGFLFGVTKSAKGQFKVDNRCVAQLTSHDEISIFSAAPGRRRR